MKIALFGKNIAPENGIYMRQLIQRLVESQVDVMVYEPFAGYLPEGFPLQHFSTTGEMKRNADLLFSIGGDGTILDAVPLLRDSGIPVLGAGAAFIVIPSHLLQWYS